MKLHSYLSWFLGLALSSVPCLAGTKDPGGGTSVCLLKNGSVQLNCDELLDAHMKRARRYIEKLPIYAKRLQPLFQQLQAPLPDFAHELQVALKAKRWYFTTAALPELGAAGNQTDFQTKQRAVQFQNDREIWIDQAWYDSQEEDDQAGIILHELGMHLRLQTEKVLEDRDAKRPNSNDFQAGQYDRNYHISVSDVRGLTEFLLGDLPDPEEIQQTVHDFHFGSYLLAGQIKQFEQETRDAITRIDQACRLPDKDDQGRIYDPGQTENKYDASQSPRLRALYNAMANYRQMFKKFDSPLRRVMPLKQRIYQRYELDVLWRQIEAGHDLNSTWYVDSGRTFFWANLQDGVEENYYRHAQVCERTVWGRDYNCTDRIERTCKYARAVMEDRYP